MSGYIVDYSVKDGWFSNIDAWERKKALMTREKLAYILLNEPLFIVWNVTYVNFNEYRKNHDSKTYEDMTR